MKLKDSFRKFFKNFLRKLFEIFSKKSVIAFTFTAVGAFSILFWQHIDQKFLYKNKSYSADFDDDFLENFQSNLKSRLEEQNELIEEFWDDDSSQSKMFEKLAKIEEEMHRSMIANHKKMEQIFEESHANKISDQRQKANFFLTKNISANESIYELHFQGFKPEEIEVKIEKNFLVFRAKNNHLVSSSNQISHSSGFHYAISLGSDEANGKLEIIRQPSKITAKIIKKSVVN